MLDVHQHLDPIIDRKSIDLHGRTDIYPRIHIPELSFHVPRAGRGVKTMEDPPWPNHLEKHLII